MDTRRDTGRREYMVAGDHLYVLVLFVQDRDEAGIERALARARAAIHRTPGGR